MITIYKINEDYGFKEVCFGLTNKQKEILGQRFGRLIVHSVNPEKINGTTYNCLCDCGNTTVRQRQRLIGGKAKSCGCIYKQHGLNGHYLYSTVVELWRRCNREYMINSIDYRDVLICDTWLEYDGTIDYEKVITFLEKLLHEQGYTKEDVVNKKVSLDKDLLCTINNVYPKKYSPETVMWIPRGDNSRFSKNTRWVSINGVFMTEKQGGKYLGKQDRYLNSRRRTNGDGTVWYKHDIEYFIGDKSVLSDWQINNQELIKEYVDIIGYTKLF